MSSRKDAIKALLDHHPNSFFIFSNGLTSREAAYFERQDRCIYLLHAMGEALAVGIGLASSIPSLEIVVVDGDGNAQMGLSSWCLMPLPNIKYYVLANGIYETTGGQNIPALPFIPSWCNVIDISQGKIESPNPPDPKEIWDCSQNWLDNFQNSLCIKG